MNLADKMEIFDGIDDRYLWEAAPKRLLAYGSTRNENVYAQRHLPLLFIETVASVATIALIVGAIFIWTLVGKNLLKAESNSNKATDKHEEHDSVIVPEVTSRQDEITTVPDTTTIPDITTSSRDDTTDPKPVYTEGLNFKLNDEKNGYVLYHYRYKDYVDVINIPSIYNGLPVTEIGAKVFCYSTMKEVNIPNSVKIIGENAFYGCWELEKVDLPPDLELIGKGAFGNCWRLQSIVIPEGVTEIGEAAFEGCSTLKEIKIPDSVISIGGYAFLSCDNLEKLVLSEGLEMIGAHAFACCDKLTDFVIPDSVKMIGDEAFYSCPQLTDMTVPESVTVLGSSIFSGCTNLKRAVINAKVKNATSLFYRCKKLEIIVFGEGIEGVGDVAICEMDSLKQVFLPSTVRNIYSCSFSYGQSLTDLEIIYNGTVAQWQAVNIEYPYAIDDQITVHCTDGDCIEGNNFE